MVQLKNSFKSLFTLAALLFSSSLFAQINHWETVVYGDDVWSYHIGSSDPGAGWQDTTFDDSGWPTGQGGFGYSDGDDNTDLGSDDAVFIRLNFNIVDTSVIQKAVLNMDYDDGFVAYLNGTEIARGNIGTAGVVPSYTDRADGSHEAVLYNGGTPESFILDKSSIKSLLLNGDNLLSVQVHNSSNFNNDMSCIPYLSLGINDASSDYRTTPSWFVAPYTFSSNLPIVTINTNNQAIPDEPKIPATIGIIYNGPGVLNNLDDYPTELLIDAMIEQRGETSQGFDKKSWAFETKDPTGNDTNVAFLNFPKEEDWILYGPYSDKTFLRNVVIMKIGREMGAYHSRTRVVEVVLNGEYRGVYVIMERIKRDSRRLDLPKLKVVDTAGMQLTGGYIFRIDKGNHGGWRSQYDEPGNPGTKMDFQYFYPGEFDIVPKQEAYIKSYVDSFEQALKAPNFIGAYGHRYNEYIEWRSFFDFFIINEVGNNIDGYRLSSYFHKNKDTKDGLLHAGPFWDFNLSLGNGDYCEGDVYDKWQYLGCAISEGGPFWWQEFISDTMFTRGLKCRWDELRPTTLSTSYLMNYIDSIQAVIDSAAATRNYDLYPVLGTRVWPNPAPYYNTYGEEVDDMQNWLTNRLAWLEANMPGTAANCDDFIPCWVMKNRFSVNACNSYTVPSGDETYTTPGIYTVKDTLMSSCGVDSLLTIDITLDSTTNSTDVITACVSYTWVDGITYTADNNTAKDTLASLAGCDSIITLDLTISSPNAGTDVIASCDPITWIDGVTYTASNNSATDTLTNINGCDSVVTLDLTINNTNTRTDTVLACSAYTWIDGNTYSTDDSTSIHIIANPSGCDSIITLNLTISNTNTRTDTIIACDNYTWLDGINYTASDSTATHIFTNPSGCDSTLTLHLTINPLNTGTDSIVACDTYTWRDGITYTASNTSATYTFTNPAGCDSIITLNLTINTPTASIDTIVACDPYTWLDGNTYTAIDSTATFTLTNANGCDSIVTLNISFNYVDAGNDSVSSCSSYIWIDGNTYTNDNNTATHILSAPAGCDSIITLALSMNAINAGTDTITACDSYTWLDGTTYTASNNTATHLLTNPSGCDSMLTLDLTIISNTATDNITACETYTWMDGNTYTNNNNAATHTVINPSGCDSTYTLNLTISTPNSGTHQVVTCNAFTWIDGNTYTESNYSATHTIKTVGGCDSTVTLNLSMQTIYAGTDTIISCDESYTWIDGNSYTENNYTAKYIIPSPNGCDSSITLHLTLNKPNNTVTNADGVFTALEPNANYRWLNCDDEMAYTGISTQNYVPTVSGNFAVEVSKNACIDTSECSGITVISSIIGNSLFKDVTIFPNPSTGLINISLGDLKNVSMRAYSLYGHVVYERLNFTAEQIQLDIKGADGIYFIEIYSEGIIQKYKVVKE